RLPERFRSASVLCYLEGLTHEMAADQLGCPVGTIRSRLATARERLRKRLIRRGLAPAALAAESSRSGLLTTSGSAVLPPPVPVPLVDYTVRSALCVGMGKTALAGVTSVEAIALMKGVLTIMVTNKVLLLTAIVLASGILATGAGVTAYSKFG